MTEDVIIVGGGPAGSIAALNLARAGVRVTVLDRATFPRDKLCGDSVNPGAMALLARHGLAAMVEVRGLPVEGWLVTGTGGAAVRAPYPDGVTGRSIRRHDLDALLLEAAARAGARVEQGTRVIAPTVEGVGTSRRVTGVRTATSGGSVSRPSPLVIAADGRHSTIAFDLGLARHPRRPRRWAIGGYFEGVCDLSTFGEMHVRRTLYIGIAPMPGGLTNACLAVPERHARAIGADPDRTLTRVVATDPLLRDRFAGARLAMPARSLGPLAVDVSSAAVPGLLLAGDAAGFVDPMTGDGLRLAMHGGELAAEAAREILEGRGDGAALAARRRTVLSGKMRFNRLLRTVVATPMGVSAASRIGDLWPGLVASLVAYAGDCQDPGLPRDPAPITS